MLVLDAGAAVNLLLQRPAAQSIWAQFEVHGHDVHAPELLDVEVLSTLRKLILRSELRHVRADQAVTDLRDLPVVRHGHGSLIDRAWALRANVTPYDGLYVALTEALGHEASLLTTDARLARALAQQTGARVLTVE